MVVSKTRAKSGKRVISSSVSKNDKKSAKKTKIVKSYKHFWKNVKMVKKNNKMLKQYPNGQKKF